MILIIFWIATALIALALLIFNICIFGFLHQSYFLKVSRASFIEDLKEIIDGKMTNGGYDSLTSVTIVQDKLLNECQGDIVSMEGVYTKDAKDGYFFNDQGNQKISKMIEMLQTTKEPVLADSNQIRDAWKHAVFVVLADFIVIGALVWIFSLIRH